jgi:hypothetical protein
MKEIEDNENKIAMQKEFMRDHASKTTGTSPDQIVISHKEKYLTNSLELFQTAKNSYRTNTKVNKFSNSIEVVQGLSN